VQALNTILGVPPANLHKGFRLDNHHDTSSPAAKGRRRSTRCTRNGLDRRKGDLGRRRRRWGRVRQRARRHARVVAHYALSDTELLGNPRVAHAVRDAVPVAVAVAGPVEICGLDPGRSGLASCGAEMSGGRVERGVSCESWQSHSLCPPLRIAMTVDRGGAPGEPISRRARHCGCATRHEGDPVRTVFA
jgi:hypothetical protein